MTAHVHAENMRLYALDAAETAYPNERWEFNCDGKHWIMVSEQHPAWVIQYQYRRKPRTHMVNGFEVPAPMVEAPIGDRAYWIPAIDSRSYASCSFWDGDSFDATRLQRGLVHATKEAAVANAKAMVGVQP